MVPVRPVCSRFPGTCGHPRAHPTPGPGSNVLGPPGHEARLSGHLPSLRPPQAPGSRRWRRPCVASERASSPPLNSGQGQCPRTGAKGRPLPRPAPATSPHAGGGSDLRPDTADMLYCFIRFSSGRRTLPGLRGPLCPVGHFCCHRRCLFLLLYLCLLLSRFSWCILPCLFVSLLPITFPRGMISDSSGFGGPPGAWQGGRMSPALR